MLPRRSAEKPHKTLDGAPQWVNTSHACWISPDECLVIKASINEDSTPPTPTTEKNHV